MNAAFTVQIEIMLRILLSFLFIFAPFYSQANEPGGSVCLGKNLSVVWDEHTERLHITIGDSPKIYFNIPRNSPRIVAKDLDKNANHTVKVYFDGHVVQSWNLNFSNLETDNVLIWRARGAWRMEPMQNRDCK